MEKMDKKIVPTGNGGMKGVIDDHMGGKEYSGFGLSVIQESGQSSAV